MMMKTMIRSASNVTVLSLDGEIDIVDTEGFGQSLDLAASEMPKAVVLDFTGVTYIASSGIAMIMRFVQQIRRDGGKARIACVNPRVQTVLDMVNLGSLVEF